MVDFETVRLPISLLECVYTTFTVEWNIAEDEKMPPFPARVDIDASIEHIGAEEGKDLWYVQMGLSSVCEDDPDDDDVEIDSDYDGMSQLYFDIEIYGVFCSAVPESNGHLEHIHAGFAAEAAQTLYGMVRERLAQATYCSRFGPYFLPTVNLYIHPQVIDVVKKEKNFSDENCDASDKAPLHLKIVKD